MVERDGEIKVLGEINVELESGTNKLIEKLSQEKDSPDDFYGFMYDTDDDASISGKSSEHFGWDWPEKDSPKVAGEVVFNPLVHEEVAEEVIEIANDQAEGLSDQEVADNCLHVEHVLGEINVELESVTHKVIEKLSQEKYSQEEALKEFNLTLDNVLEKLSQEKDSPDDFYGFMYDTNNDASISGKSSDHFGWDWPEMDSLVIEVDWQDDPFHETKDLFVGLDQAIQVAEEVIEMANDQAEALSDQEVADNCLHVEHVEERRPSKRIRVTQEEMVKDEKPKKG
ncbi:hypothetical protein Tco_1391468 [Tanacetum coccineum]